MSDGTWITLISLGVTLFFMLGTPVLLIIFYWVVGISFVIDLPLANTGNELINVFSKGFALLAMPLFILTGDLINQSGIARRLSDFAYSCLGWLRGGLAMASIAPRSGPLHPEAEGPTQGRYYFVEAFSGGGGSSCSKM